MTEAQALAAARVLTEDGQYDAADLMYEAAEVARSDYFHEMAEREYDDPDFALAREEDRREGF